MDLGLYTLKYPARRLLAGLLPALRHVDPNWISWAMLPVGAAVAAAYYLAAGGQSGLFLVGAALILTRMFLGTMDGLVATHYGKATLKGDLINRLMPELCDVMYMLALAVARPEWQAPAIGALAAAWLITFSGLLGATVGQPVQSVGPAGQTDRLVVLIILSVLAFAGERAGWGVDFMLLFLWWVIVGGAITVVLRLRRQFGALPAGDPQAAP